MPEIKNNIFSFATKELSQDAVICWCLEWINYPTNSLYLLAKDLFALMGQTNVSEKIEIKQQFKKADIIVILRECKKIIIIEDKVYSTEHDNQIEKYKNTIKESATELGFSDTDEIEISTVYFKTGFFYDSDKLVIADYIVDGNAFYKTIEKYSGISEILDDYIPYLKDLIEWYEKNDDYCAIKDGKRIISSTNIAQYRFMRSLFPEELWDRKSKAYYVESDSNTGGRPWTELRICEDPYFKEPPNTKDSYQVFWRIDTDEKGPYLSLRFYEYMNKKDENVKSRHRNMYKLFLEELERIVDNDTNLFNWEIVKDGYKGNYNESSLLRIGLETYLDDWIDKEEAFVSDIRVITNEFLKIIP